MKSTYLLAAVCVALISSPVIAEDDHPSENSHMKIDSSMPMHDKEKCKMMSKMNMEQKKEMMQMKKKHMQTVENHLANIEELLKQLVEIKKQKSTD